MGYSEKEIQEWRKKNPELDGRNPVLSQMLGPAPGQAPAENKFHAEKNSYNGRVYPSIHQAQVAHDFDLAKNAGKIKGFIEEVPFALPGKTDQDKPYIHRVDFGVIELNDVVTWWEAKGKDLVLGKMKRRQVEELYHIKIHII